MHQESEKCLKFTPQTKSKKRFGPKRSVLRFLSDVVKDVSKEIALPFLDECDENDQDQLWSMNLEVKWQ